MCGITGIIHPKHREFIQPMTQIIAHRGPDGEGFFSDESISLGHRRLAIQDLSANGHQPMFTEDGRYCIILNGEIYNHFDIRAKLKDKYTFRSTSDTETVLYGYVEYGLDILNMLNGIFAMAIYDTHTHDLIVARDQFGVKPLYYYHNNKIFIFASEMKSILKVHQIEVVIDPSAINQYMRLLWTPGENTMIRQIKKLLPGHYLKLNTSQHQSIDISKYYSIPFNGRYDAKTEDEWIDKLDSHLLKAVERQLLSDVPIGFFLSGGLDSSTVVAMAKRLRPNNILKCYTIDSGSKELTEEGFSDDLFYAKKVAQHLGVDLTVVEGRSTTLELFDKMIYHLDEPQADIAPIHVLNICKKAREDGIIVLLGGTAGDDLFSGYRRHQALRVEKYHKYVPKWAAKTLKSISFKFSSKSVLVRRVRKILNDWDKPVEDRLVGYYSWLPEKISKSVLSANLRHSITGFNALQSLKDTLEEVIEEPSLLNKMLYLDLKHFLVDHNLNYTDKLSMATGVEVRVPFLDKELVEFSTKIPPELKLKGMTTKYLLKKVMERYLPHEVIYRPKAGFGAPVRSWIKNDLSEYIDKSFNQKDVEAEGLFDYFTICKMIEDNKSGKEDYSYAILSLIAVRSWYHSFGKLVK